MPDSGDHFRRARVVADEASELRRVAASIEHAGFELTEQIRPTRRMLTPDIWDSTVAEERTRQLGTAQARLDEARDLLDTLAERLRLEAGERDAEADFHLVRGWIETGREATPD